MSDLRPVILCIGSHQVSGDMLGPLVGSILLSEFRLNAYVYGTLERPVNGINIGKYLNLIKNLHRDNLLISVDAAVGASHEIGSIKYKSEGITAGAALGRNSRVGGMGIVGVVAENKGDVLSNLMASDYYLVERLSRKIATIIYKTINHL
ncbi:MAG: DUF1256 domain-containing protein [Christensenellales bacterium]|jgi:putative sporulation protein YyaC